MGKEGGGVSIYVRNNLQAKLSCNSNPIHSNTPEFAIFEMKNMCNILLLAVVHRRHKAAYSHHFFSCLSEFLSSCNNILIRGDFNINMQARDGGAKAMWLYLQAQSLFLVPSEATHHTRTETVNCDTWLDLFITHSESAVLEYRKSEAPFIAGHDYTELDFQFSKPINIPKTIQIRDLQNIDADVFKKWERDQAYKASRQSGVTLD